MSQFNVRVRRLTTADLEFAMRLKSVAGWNQLEADWRRFLELDPAGCFLVEADHCPAGTVTVLRYENRFAWIGMMLVEPAFRRRGLATTLMTSALDYLAESNIATAKLDATPTGKTVYDGLGFVDEHRIERRVRPDGSSRTVAAVECAPIAIADLGRLAAWDRAWFGADRGRVLESLFLGARHLAFQTEGGFVLGRPGAMATSIGPLVAENASAADRLLRTALAAVSAGPVYLDVPMCHQTAVGLSVRHGFQTQRELVRQYRGPNSYPGDPANIFAIAGPELG